MGGTRSRDHRSEESSWRDRQLLGIPASLLFGLSGVAGLAALVAAWVT